MSKRQRVIRAEQEQLERWDADAEDAGMSFNSWAASVLDAHSGGFVTLEASEEEVARFDAAAAQAGMGFNAWAVRVLDQASDGSASVPGLPPTSEPTSGRAPRHVSEPRPSRAPRTMSESEASSPQSKRSYQPDWKPEKRKKG